MTATEINEQLLNEAATLSRGVVDEVAKAFIGPREISELLLTALVAGGHVLLEGVPGVAKTTLVKTFSSTLACSYKRIQFTPDLLPADITGTYVLNQQTGAFVLREGPIFANIILGDEINRAPAKTQSALLEAMQENQVTIEGETRPLVLPFMVLATQNPIEQEGTYPLPEAQIDRFMMKAVIGYPTARQEHAILRAYSGQPPQPKQVLGPREIMKLRAMAEKIHIEGELLDYIIGLTSFTRDHPQVQLGASPRASLQLMHAARARALLSGRAYVLPDDVKALTIPLLSHRLIMTPEAELDGVPQRKIIEEALEEIPYNKGEARR